MKVKLILEMHEFGSNFIQLGIYLIGNQLMVLNHCFYNRKVECGQSLSPKRSEIRLKKNWLAQVLDHEILNLLKELEISLAPRKFTSHKSLNRFSREQQYISDDLHLDSTNT